MHYQATVNFKNYCSGLNREFNFWTRKSLGVNRRQPTTVYFSTEIYIMEHWEKKFNRGIKQYPALCLFLWRYIFFFSSANKNKRERKINEKGLANVNFFCDLYLVGRLCPRSPLNDEGTTPLLSTCRYNSRGLTPILSPWDFLTLCQTAVAGLTWLEQQAKQSQKKKKRIAFQSRSQPHTSDNRSRILLCNDHSSTSSSYIFIHFKKCSEKTVLWCYCPSL